MKNLLTGLISLLLFSSCKKELHTEILTPELPTDTTTVIDPNVILPEADINVSIEKFSWEKGEYYFENKMSGYRLIDVNRLEKTSDGGLHWEPVHVFEGYQNYVSALYYAVADTIRLAFYYCEYSDCGDCDSKLWRSEDGGANWKYSETMLTPKPVYFPSGNIGLFVNLEKAIYKTTDGGKSYLSVLEKDEKTREVAFIGKNVYVFHTNEVLVSTDLGSNWTSYPLPFPFFGFDKLYSPEPGVLVPSKRFETSLFLLKNNFSAVEIIDLPGSSFQNEISGNGGFCLMDSTVKDETCDCRKKPLFITKNGGAAWKHFANIETDAGLFSFNQEKFPIRFQHDSNGVIYKLLID